MQTNSEATPMESVTLNHEQRLYVIAQGGGYSCMGFDNARRHADQIAQRLGQPDLSFTAEDCDTLAGYRKYQAATRAWGQSPLTRDTYFDPGTSPEVIRALEACRKTRCQVRLIYGDTRSGQSWFDEFDVVGRIGRSTGWLKVPLLIEAGDIGGGAILTACLLCIINWQTGAALYTHPAYQVPDLRLVPTGDAGHPWGVQHQENELARFLDVGKAGAYLAFMRGETIEPRVFR
ncbi:hypothetical protein [Methylibium sp.]|uniref:hypothetical protein n=1 Tax=Methylibium sp. TaxID=2067992 RepID=UPI003BAB440D